ncbi:beta-galactosidase [Nitrosovibrio tenuis]|uniref:Beta-galactosidase n=1 Tax=Nitrosovibrio tenuis TaxID=1233 RepID=A0A1H7FQ11_9PROT|nr:beta-galactosidase [Nitrosovibrio tenuis]SEK26552.1 Beta-galactosidase [Nitrosovibrio tenuis]
MLFIAMCLLIFVISWLPSTDANAQQEAIPIEYFGLHIHRADQGTTWPNVPFGSWRLWDAYVAWADLEPSPGKWDFSRLDRYVAMAELRNVDILLPLANTPEWASARPSEQGSYKPGNASEPASIEDWRRYVRAVGERYKGRIRHYQIWNEINFKQHFSGSTAKLVELACEGSQILKSIDPLNRVVSPAASVGGKDHLGHLDRFLASGGKNCIDIVAHHFYVTNSGPQAMVPFIRGVRNVMRRNGIGQKPLWNTETGWWLANGDGTPDDPMVTGGGWKKIPRESKDNIIFKAFALARSEGVERFYWYAWDNRALGFIEPTTKKTKPIAEKWRSAVNALLGATDLRCIQDVNVWRCDYVASDGVRTQSSWTAEP